ncbi:MAG: NADH-quinone oxidoreductase subunit N [Actinomycetota bacterium]|nr:NADH-quinone oxidoreductase subunit N [Actinomycetota bacterium]
MIDKPTVDWLALSPVLVLLAAAGVALLAAVLVPRGSRKAVAAVVAALGFAGAGVAAAILYSQSPDAQAVIGDAIMRDRFGALAQLILIGAGLLAVGVAYVERTSSEQAGEYFALLAAAGAGMAFFVQANNLMTLFLSLEWFSICLYILCAIHHDRVDSLEAGLKYLVIGSFGSAALLFGSALVYGATGELAFDAIARTIAGQGLSEDPLLLVGLAMLIAGLAFKASAAPFHMWTPDVYEGAPTPVTAFMASATKVAALVLTLRVLNVAFPHDERFWTVTLAVIACVSLAVGNLGALAQRSVKRILAYSSVSHAGFMLIAVAAANPLGARGLLYYLIPYSAASIGAFAVVAARERELGEPVTLDNLAGFGWERPFLGLAMAVFMFGFIGLPPAGLFLGKIYVFAAAVEHGWIWLVIVGVAATALSVYYYLAVIRAMYMRTGAELQLASATETRAEPVARAGVVSGGSPPREALLQVSVAAALAVTVGSFVAVEPLIDLARDAAKSIPF